MAIYLVKRTDKIGYDEYDAFVVRAANEDQALAVAMQEGQQTWDKTWRDPDTLTVTRIDSKGDALVIMEAMKMEYTLKAPRAGKIKVLTAKPGQQVSDGALLLEIEEI